MNNDNFKITIDYVAKRAGVSKTTISRFLNGRYEYMSDATRENIKKVIEELNYRPNNLARSLKLNRSNLIGVLVSDIGNHFSSILVKGIEKVLKENGYNLIIASTDNDATKEREYILSLLDNNIDGLIINTAGGNDDFLIELSKKGLPIVLADRSIKDTVFDTVVVNNYEVTSELILHLIKNGYNRIGFFTERIGDISTRNERKQAFLDVCKKYGIDNNNLIFEVDGGLSKIEEKIISMMKDCRKCRTALFTVNGVVLLNVLQVVNKLKLKIPDDVAVCGYDDWGWASLIPPGITTISQPTYEVGVESAKMLLNRINDSGEIVPKKLVLKAELVIRRSTRSH
ncbi:MULTISPECIES: LacI family DNA-binding transcriptional regulator [Thermoanaerobacterium]|jgi:transcriptional regulator, LacI family|uniref:LacI family kdg operon repressor n=1 Tax=Thermoanaerobacterium butyriciformans TaxID=1702242 RepID=A0ABS4NFK5_9THEO|nr:LacI family DNA-binding transcriptional regulator [Thermoanaerobacterium butyriciformans]MBP2072437.1 LacI family kdg operon repressor [Thermoanaerobacterium butyriciformans]WHE06968.1 LacI family DNA-binding transcriptional regulator [Thermoanaerobacterium thermosaccharolyticum]